MQVVYMFFVHFSMVIVIGIREFGYYKHGKCFSRAPKFIVGEK